MIHASEIEKIADEIASFTGEARDTVCSKIKTEMEVQGTWVSRAWKEMNPQSEQEILDFYCTSDSYIYELMVDHNKPERRELTKNLVDLLRRYRIHTVLDFGGGVGNDSMAMAENGFQVTYFDLEGVTSSFARWRFAQRGLPIHTLSKVEEFQTYDAVVSIEVLEHLKDPLKTIRLFYDHVRSEGYLFLTHSFKMVGDHHPSHIPENRVFDRTFLLSLRENGFKPLSKQVTRLYVCQKMAPEERDRYARQSLIGKYIIFGADKILCSKRWTRVKGRLGIGH